MIVSWNGCLIDEAEVRISPFDRGLLRGEGVFETMLAVDGELEFWSRHERRLRDSASRLLLEVPESELLEAAMRNVIVANELTKGEARVRLTLSDNILVTAVPLPPLPEHCRVVTVSSPVNERSPLAGAKVCSYAENMTVLKRSGADEALRPNTRGELCEGCLSNVFFVIDGIVHGPSLDTGCLPGVIRGLLFERNATFVEGHWPISILNQANEIWLTSSTRHMTWVNQCDGRDLGQPGELFSRTLANLLKA